MRLVTLVLVLLITLGSAARAEPHLLVETHDAGMDSGGKMALAGGIVFSAAYEWTAIGGAIGSALGDSHPGCVYHCNIYYPIAGGFMDGSAGGIVGSLFQVSGLVVMTIGLVSHQWRKPVTDWTKVRF
jgi:hypothetical protein